MLQIEFEFTLPKGYVDEAGNVHKHGTMRLATAVDEIAPMRDPRVKVNASYLTILLLSRVITRLGSLPDTTPKIIEDLFSGDLVYLQDFYRKINESGYHHVEAACPACHHQFNVEATPVGGL